MIDGPGQQHDAASKGAPLRGLCRGARANEEANARLTGGRAPFCFQHLKGRSSLNSPLGGWPRDYNAAPRCDSLGRRADKLILGVYVAHELGHGLVRCQLHSDL
jgi:hypothetical protein